MAVGIRQSNLSGFHLCNDGIHVVVLLAVCSSRYDSGDAWGLVKPLFSRRFDYSVHLTSSITIVSIRQLISRRFDYLVAHSSIVSIVEDLVNGVWDFFFISLFTYLFLYFLCYDL